MATPRRHDPWPFAETVYEKKSPGAVLEFPAAPCPFPSVRYTPPAPRWEIYVATTYTSPHYLLFQLAHGDPANLPPALWVKFTAEEPGRNPRECPLLDKSFWQIIQQQRREADVMHGRGEFPADQLAAFSERFAILEAEVAWCARENG